MQGPWYKGTSLSTKATRSGRTAWHNPARVKSHVDFRDRFRWPVADRSGPKIYWAAAHVQHIVAAD
jgi:hypothetical protein